MGAISFRRIAITNGGILRFRKPYQHRASAAVGPEIVRQSRECRWRLSWRIAAIEHVLPATLLQAHRIGGQGNDSTEQIGTPLRLHGRLARQLEPLNRSAGIVDFLDAI